MSHWGKVSSPHLLRYGSSVAYFDYWSQQEDGEQA